MFSKVWKVVKEVAIGILLVLGLWLVTNGALRESNGNFQFGSLMDFVIALSNFIMAVAALIAANEAKKWFQQKNKLNNLDSAHQKIKEYEDILWATHNRIFKDTAIRANFENDVKNNNISVDEALDEVNHLLSSKTTTDLDELSLIYSEQAKLRRYGVIITENFRQIIDTVIKKRSDYLDLHYEQLTYTFVEFRTPGQTLMKDKSTELNTAKIELAKEYELIISKTSLDAHYDLTSLHMSQHLKSF
ncbi:hypothetical protein [Pantoea sp. SJZ147]|uniref:hypothetical protein n=1 Tax=Pantoea sp. SJZ147 TaxID=2572896 RepID=UPI0011A4F795|nr:hypothetical protein [Pantoea sp. SJZ147]TWD31564.1 hypothetical protein FBY13_1252 [Pantoea sp. SJZ147]